MKKILQTIYLIPLYFYKYYISGLLGVNKCRYCPSCSSYFEIAVKRFGIIKGSILGFSRLLRCRNSYLGGPDPVPEEFSYEEIKKAYKIYKKPKKY